MGRQRPPTDPPVADPGTMNALIHLIKEKTGDMDPGKGRDRNTFYTKCGSGNTKGPRKPPEMTVWESEVTCRPCAGTP